MTIKAKKFELGVKVKYNSKMVGTLGQKFSTMGQKLVLGSKVWCYCWKVSTWGQKFSNIVQKLVLGVKSLVLWFKS